MGNHHCMTSSHGNSLTLIISSVLYKEPYEFGTNNYYWWHKRWEWLIIKIGNIILFQFYLRSYIKKHMWLAEKQKLSGLLEKKENSKRIWVFEAMSSHFNVRLQEVKHSVWMVVYDWELRGCITSVFSGGALLQQCCVQF